MNISTYHIDLEHQVLVSYRLVNIIIHFSRLVKDFFLYCGYYTCYAQNRSLVLLDTGQMFAWKSFIVRFMVKLIIILPVDEKKGESYD